MGHVRNCLYRPFKNGIFDFINQNGHDNRSRKRENQPVRTDDQSVSQQSPKVYRREEAFKMLQSNPLALYNPQKTPDALVIFKCDDDSIHGKIFKNDKIGKAGQQ
jgi:hypothetical protein